MLILGIDFETTGLSPENDRVTEVGMALWSATNHQPLKVAGFLVQDTKPISAEIEKLTGISQQMIDQFGIPSNKALANVLAWVQQAEYVCAHNGRDFDKLFLEEWAKRQNASVANRPWIDTKTDLPREAYGRSASLKYMACDHGFVYDAHRACSDVLAMLKILDHYDISKVLARSQSPTLHIQALVDFANNTLAKEAGFHWKAERKQWILPIKQTDLAEMSATWNFKFRLLEAQ